MLQRVVFGTKTSEANAKLADLNWREFGLVLPLIALMLFMGVYPGPFLTRSRASIEALARRVYAALGQPQAPELRDAVQALSRAIVAPVAGRIAGKRLAIVTEGVELANVARTFRDKTAVCGVNAP